MEDSPSRFPDRELHPAGVASRRVRAAGADRLRAAIRLVRDLPYGRTSDETDYLAVPTEGVGTCSTKHALLAAVCDEQGIDDVDLTLGIYEMCDRNTPGVGPVFSDHGLESIPEAHCYLRYDGARFDFTRDESGEPIDEFLHEESIDPDQIGQYKRDRHRTFLSEWRASRAIEMTVDELWDVREDCIAALSEAEDGHH